MTPSERSPGERVYCDAVDTLKLIQQFPGELKRPDVSHLILPAARRLVRSLRGDLLQYLTVLRRKGLTLEALRGPAISDLKRRLSRQPRRIQRAVRQEIDAMKRRLNLDAQVCAAATESAALTKSIVNALTNMQAALNKGRSPEALRAAQRAARFAARNCSLTLSIAIAAARYRQNAAQIIMRAMLDARRKP